MLKRVYQKYDFLPRRRLRFGRDYVWNTVSFTAQFRPLIDFFWGFPDGSVVKNLSADAGDAGDAGEACSISGSGTSPGAGNGIPLQYSWGDNPMDRGGCQATAHGITESQTRWAWTKTSSHRCLPQWQEKKRSEQWIHLWFLSFPTSFI